MKRLASPANNRDTSVNTLRRVRRPPAYLLDVKGPPLLRVVTVLEPWCAREIDRFCADHGLKIPDDLEEIAVVVATTLERAGVGRFASIKRRLTPPTGYAGYNVELEWARLELEHYRRGRR